MSDDRYARIYFDRIARDPKFDGIRDNRALMGSWQFLLVEAEKSWPSPAFPPPTSWVPRKDFRLFVERGIVDEVPDGRYRVHGLDSIRAERTKRAKDAADARWDAGRNAERNASASAGNMPRRDETSTDETRRASARDLRPIDPLFIRDDSLLTVTPLVGEAWMEASGLHSVLASPVKAQEVLIDICRRHPEGRVIAAIYEARDQFEHVPEAHALVYAVLHLLDPFLDPKAIAKTAAKTAAQADEQARSQRARLNTLRTIHSSGSHSQQPDPRCPDCTGAAA